MKSTNYVNFSVRQNKTIERAIVFDGLRRILSVYSGTTFVYIGLGSIWFVDFDVAHRELAIDKMVSIEADEVIYKRAKFNKPYRTVEVVHGHSHDVLPDLVADRGDLTMHPWIVWLDYDEAIDETKLDELAGLIANLPSNSVLLTTFNAAASRYERRPVDRRDRFEQLFGDAFPTEQFTSTADAKNELKVMSALSDAVLDFMESTAVRIARRGEFVPAFNLRYKDGSPMATVGGVLPDETHVAAIDAEISRSDWTGIASEPIVTPPLTQREAASLRSLLPDTVTPTRADVEALGFDLLPEQIASFAEHYLKYPSFVQTVR